MALGNALDINFLPNQLIYANTATTVAGLVTGINEVLITSGAGVPSLSNTLPLAVQANITQLGVITAGTWDAGIISPIYGGTGINNGANTLTLAGTLATIGAFASIFTMTGATNVTFPTAGTLATTAGTIASITGTANQINVSAGINPTLSISNTMIFPGTVTLNADPVTNLQAATKQYVDSFAAGITVKMPCNAGTTGALTSIYANGAAGIGATLTNAGAMAAFTIDGVSPAINSRILVKDQITTFENGIYTLTTVGSGAVNWVLTRAVDYDQPAEIQPGNLIPVSSGTINANTSWIQTDIVANIGVDPIQFSQFTYGSNWRGNPIELAYGGTSANLVASNGGIFYSTAATGAILAGTATARQMLQSGATAAPAWSTAIWPATTTINRILYSSANNTVNELATSNKSVLTTGATGIPVLTALALDGQIIIGSTAGVPGAATLTPGAGIAIANAGNSITISATGAGLAWTDVTGAAQALAVENGYITNRGAGVTYTLPAAGVVGDIIQIVGKLGLTTIAQNANQQILLSSSSTIVGVGGSIAGTNVGDCITLICITAGAATVWRASSIVGNWTVT